MIKILKNIIGEPLLHFLLLGALLYLYYDLNSQEDTQTKQNISLLPNEIETIKSNYLQNNGVTIDKEILEFYKSEEYYKKILLNEAYALGLEKQDKQIQEKLLKQMQFIMTNQSQILEPSEEALFEYYEKNIADYSAITDLSFAHIFFSNPKDKRIDRVLELLNIAEVSPQKAAYFGDKFEASNFVDAITPFELEQRYGKYFRNKVLALKKGLWHKAIHSKYGVHLVYVRSKTTTDPYSFDEIQERVYLDYKQEELHNRVKKAYSEFRSQYLIEGK